MLVAVSRIAPVWPASSSSHTPEREVAEDFESSARSSGGVWPEGHSVGRMGKCVVWENTLLESALWNRPAATCFAPNAGPPLWFANLLLIPQSTENFSPPELNGKLLLLRSSSKPRAASKVAPSAPQLLLPESGSNARIPLVSESQTEPSSSLLSLARSDTAQRHTSGSALEMMNEPLPPLQKGESPHSVVGRWWWDGCCT